MNVPDLELMLMLTNLAESRYRYVVKMSIARHNYGVACSKGWPPSEIKTLLDDCEAALDIIHEIDSCFAAHFVAAGRVN